MALLWMDGFDHWGTGATGRSNMLDGAYAEVNTNSGPTNSRSRTGVNSCFLTPTGTIGLGLRRVFPGSTKTVAAVGYALWLNELPDDSNELSLVSFRNTSNGARVTISMDTTGRATVIQGGVDFPSDPVLHTTDAPVFVAGAWQFLECRADVVGDIELRVNGVTVISLAGQSWASSGNFAQVIIGPSADGVSMWIDDLFAWDDTGDYNNDFLGDRRVLTILPDADTLQADWSISGAADGYAAIDDIPPDDDTSYIESDTINDVSEFEIAELPAEVVSVAGVFTQAYMRKTDAGEGSVQVSMVSAAIGSPPMPAVALGVDRAMTTAYTYYQDIFEEDPATGAPWTRDGLAAALLRFEKTA
jgi:hypothetical protein